MHRRSASRPWRIVATAALAASSLAGTVLAQDAAAKTVNVEFIVDSSGSMAAATDTGALRIDAARSTLDQVISQIPASDNVNVGLRVYGQGGDNTDAGKAESCESTELVVPVDGVNQDALSAGVNGIVPTGWTPIGQTLQKAQADFPVDDENTENIIILVTDGLETCGWDPGTVAGELAASPQKIQTNVIGFGTTAEEQGILESISTNGGGQIFSASNAGSLSDSIFTMLEQQGVVAQSGDGSQSNIPFTVGRTGGNDQWTINVTGTNPNATDLVMQLHPDVAAPAEDEQFSTANFIITNTSDKPMTFDQINFNAVDSNGNVYPSTDNSCGIGPVALDGRTELQPGESAEVNVCWKIKQTSAESLQVAAQPADQPESAPIWFSLSNPHESTEPINFAMTGVTPTVAATTEPTVAATATTEPTVEPTATTEPTVEPTATTEPTVEPTATTEPTVEPTATTEPTVEPTATTEPTATMEPTATTEPTPTMEATPEATEMATPTAEATLEPIASATPTAESTIVPMESATPTAEPTIVPIEAGTPDLATPAATEMATPEIIQPDASTPEAATPVVTVIPATPEAATPSPEVGVLGTPAPVESVSTPEAATPIVTITPATPDIATPAATPSPEVGVLGTPAPVESVATPEAATPIVVDDATPEPATPIVVVDAATPEVTAPAIPSPEASAVPATPDAATPVMIEAATPEVDVPVVTAEASPVASPAASPVASPAATAAVNPNPLAITENTTDGMGINPIKIGQTGRVGDYEITVLGPVVQAETVDPAASPVASPAAASSSTEASYVVKLRYVGTDPSNPYADLVMTAMGPTGVGYYVQCPAGENSILSLENVQPGDTETGIVCWMVQPGDEDTLLLKVEDPFNPDAKPLWFDLTNN